MEVTTMRGRSLFRRFWKSALRAIAVVSDKNTIASTVASTLASTIFVFSLNVGWDIYSSHVRQRRDLVHQFASEALDFNIFVQDYVHSIQIRSNSVPEARNHLVDNLIQQRQMAMALESRTKVDHLAAFRSYVHALEAMNRAIPGHDNMLEMAKFWNRASTVVYERNKLLSELGA